MSTDIRLNTGYQPIVQASGDMALISGNDCFLQSLRIEAASAEGDLWYDPAWGWSLLDFKDSLQEELTLLELEQRIRSKLATHEEILVGSIEVHVSRQEDSFFAAIAFRLLSDGELRQMNIIGRTEIEVIEIA